MSFRLFTGRPHGQFFYSTWKDPGPPKNFDEFFIWYKKNKFCAIDKSY